MGNAYLTSLQLAHCAHFWPGSVGKTVNPKPKKRSRKRSFLKLKTHCFFGLVPEGQIRMYIGSGYSYERPNSAFQLSPCAHNYNPTGCTMGIWRPGYKPCLLDSCFSGTFFGLEFALYWWCLGPRLAIIARTRQGNMAEMSFQMKGYSWHKWYWKWTLCSGDFSFQN